MTPPLHYIDELIQIAINQDPENADTGTHTENLCERFFWTLADASFNIVGVVNQSDQLVERFAPRNPRNDTPYGQRTVYSHGWLLADVDQDGDVDDDDEQLIDTTYWGESSDEAQIADLDGNGYVGTGDLEGVFLPAYPDALHADDPLVTHSRLTSFRTRETNPTGTNILATGLCEFGHQGLMHDETIGGVDNRYRYYLPRVGRFAQGDPLGYPDGMSRFAAYHHLMSGQDPSGLDGNYGGLVGPLPRKSYPDSEGAARRERKRQEYMMSCADYAMDFYSDSTGNVLDQIPTKWAIDDGTLDGSWMTPPTREGPWLLANPEATAAAFDAWLRSGYLRDKHRDPEGRYRRGYRVGCDESCKQGYWKIQLFTYRLPDWSPGRNSLRGPYDFHFLRQGADGRWYGTVPRSPVKLSYPETGSSLSPTATGVVQGLIIGVSTTGCPDPFLGMEYAQTWGPPRKTSAGCWCICKTHEGPEG